MTAGRVPHGALVGVMLLLVRSARERRAVFERMCREGAQALIYAGEAWIAVAKAGSLELEFLDLWRQQGRRLEELPGRAEALVVLAAWAGGTAGRVWRIEREGGLRLIAVDQAAGVLADGGTMVGLPWQVGPEAR